MKKADKLDRSTDGRNDVQWKYRYTSETLIFVVVNRTRADKATPGESTVGRGSGRGRGGVREEWMAWQMWKRKDGKIRGEVKLRDDWGGGGER